MQSAGTISGDFLDGFRITGTHTYAAAGTDDVTVTLRDANGRIVQPAATTPLSGVDTQRYHVSIDTGSIAGSSGSLALLFDPGALPGAPDATLNISNLVVTGGTVGAFNADGGASGDPATSATLQASEVLNRLLGAVTFGTRLDFDIELSGAALSKPAGGNFGSAFALQLLGADGKTPLLGADATGSVLRIDVSPTGSTRATTADSAVDAAALGRATVSNPTTQLALTLQAFSVQEGTVYTGAVGSFTSSNLSQTAGQFSALIDWGDGSDPTLGTVTGAAGHFSISGTHTYAVTGNYQLGVTLDDGQGDAVFETSPLTGQGKFQVNPAPLYLSTQNVAPLVADLNGDGLPDVVAADWLTNSKLQVFLNTGNADFAAAIDLPAGVNANGKLVAGDFNGDGKTDIGYFSVNSSGVRSIGTLLGDGTGHFTASPAATIVAPNVVSLIATDVDGDGKLDIVAGTGFSGGANLPGEVLILKGVGDGSFQAPDTMTLASGNLTVIASDLNRDGHPDLVVGSTGLLEVLMNDGNGNFTPGATLAVTAATFFAVTDLNGDGIPDIVAGRWRPRPVHGGGGRNFHGKPRGARRANRQRELDRRLERRWPPRTRYGSSAGSSPTALLEVFSEGSDGRFIAVNSSVIANDATALSAEDFNGDGKLDVGVAGSAQLSLFLGRGDTTLAGAKGPERAH